MGVTVSICIPAYRHPELLRRALQSIVIQSYEDFEVVVTDDSPDDSVQGVVAEFRGKLDLLYFRNKERKGSPGNWNEAVRHASGKYIKMLHHDDCFITADDLAGFVALVEGDDAVDFGFCASLVTDGESERVVGRTQVELERLRSDCRTLYPENIIGAPSATIYRNLKHLEYDERLKWVVDIDFYLRVLSRNPNFAYSATPMVQINVGDHQVTGECQENRALLLFEWIYLYRKVFGVFGLNVVAARFIWNLMRTHRVRHVDELLSAGNDRPLPLIVSAIVFTQRLCGTFNPKYRH